jgi:hypothetical protein
MKVLLQALRRTPALLHIQYRAETLPEQELRLEARILER